VALLLSGILGLALSGPVQGGEPSADSPPDANHFQEPAQSTTLAMQSDVVLFGGLWRPIEQMLNSRARMVQMGVIGMFLGIWILFWRRT